ncbi:dihydrofolate reductase [Lepeophtheirus salmonis]|nr:dihydrofolate reductase-like [Lepeophtheirus salmonis]
MSKSIPTLHVIAAACRPTNGIGKNNTLPWNLPTDLKYFKTTTSSTPDSKVAVIMGRRTWESIPSKLRPLKNRINVVLTTNSNFVAEGAILASSLEEGIKSCMDQADKIWIIGGANLYKEAMQYYKCQIFLTEIDKEFECDTFFPSIDSTKYKEVSVSEDHVENGITFRFKRFERLLQENN